MGVIENKIKSKREEQKDLANKRLILLKRDLEIATASPEGLNLMRWIFDLSGYSKILIAGNTQTGEILDRGTLYNNARRSIWLEIRQLLPKRILRKIEYEKLNLNVEEL